MPKIFVIEDDNILSKAIFEALSSEGFETELLKDGSEALEKIKKFNPDLILLDLLLPGKPGEVILKEVRHTEETKNIPVLVITVKAGHDSVNECEALGISGYFIKAHYTLAQIIEEIKKVLAK